jgi:pyruvate,water dikinase
MSSYVLRFQEIDKTKLMLVGGKGANLGELSRIEDISVPDGFCISTEAFERAIGETASINELLDQLSLLRAPALEESQDRDKIVQLSRQVRRVIEGIAIPQDITDEITRHLSRLGENDAYAVRSSATAEDLPAASFAGQHDTYLNIAGTQAILKHITKCWASLYTDRAVIYRLQNGFDQPLRGPVRKVHLAVVVQKMVSPQTSGILFTADPLTSNRKVSSIDAAFGLGEAIVSGLVNPDLYKVRNGGIVHKQIATKHLAIYPAKAGGTKQQQIEPERQKRQVLTDEQILRLERLGRKIEAHFGHPQDIEWSLVDDTFYILQSRPITTLFPVPEANDQENHVYISVGHQQMMTDPMKPLGLSLWQLTAGRPMYAAGGRLFVDVTHDLASPSKREILVNVLGKSDPLIRGPLVTILERGDFIKSLPDDKEEGSVPKGDKALGAKQGQQSEATPAGFQTLLDYDPTIVSDLISRSEASLEELQQRIQAKSGVDLIDFILQDIEELKKSLSDPESFGVFMTAMNASSWINEKMEEWLGEKKVADTISQSVPNNITSEMGLALLELADVIRPYPEVIDYLQHAREDDSSATHSLRSGLKAYSGQAPSPSLRSGSRVSFWDELVKVHGGREARDAISAYLAKYGMRCVGEIDITRTRWSERPTTLVPMILRNIEMVEPGASKRRFEQGRQEALRKEEELLERLRQLPDGEKKAQETKRMISLVRNLIGYREYPKYALVNRYFVYKQALLKEAERLVQANVIHEQADIYYLTLEELREVVRTHNLDYQIISKRKEEYKLYERLTPPRVITSDGEIIVGEYKRENLPAGAMAGLPVSSGVIEGRARVILKMEDADLEGGDILVTSFTDPSWTPLFVSIRGLVTEVGGLMTHGAVIAREYGLPAVVGVENATKLIKDGQRIRVDGTEGYVEII